MAHWLTALADARWIKELYADDPQNPSAKVLVRAVYGINRQSSDGLIDTLNATKSVPDPYADGVVNTGTWRVIKNECRPVNEGELSGSDVIVQTLGQGYFTTLSASNKIVVKNLVECEEQNENAWMYYARNVVTETCRFINISPAALFETTPVTIFPYTTDVTLTVTGATYDTAWIADQWYEKEQDGSYSIYRTLKARSLTSVATYRAAQYAGMILVDRDNLPVEGDNHIHLTGFRNATETIYQYAKLIVGGETYRVTANATAVTGAATVSVSPEITATTEDYCDPLDDSYVQCYFEALT